MMTPGPAKSMSTPRVNSLLVHVRRRTLRCVLTNLVEHKPLLWDDSVFRPVDGYAGFYEYLRSVATGRIVGLEFHLATDKYDLTLNALEAFEKCPPLPTIPHRWRLWFTREPSEIQWEQILSENPYLSENGEAVVVAQVCHLDDVQYSQLARLTELGEFRPQT